MPRAWASALKSISSAPTAAAAAAVVVSAAMPGDSKCPRADVRFTAYRREAKLLGELRVLATRNLEPQPFSCELLFTRACSTCVCVS